MPIKIDASLGGNAGFYKDGTIAFKSENNIKVDHLSEELIHAVQFYQFYGNDMDPNIRNYEFEAKVFQDFTCLINNGFCPQIATTGMPHDFVDNYNRWLGSMYEKSFRTSDVSIFNDFCNSWTGYPGDFDSSFTPDMLEYYFKE